MDEIEISQPKWKAQNNNNNNNNDDNNWKNI